MRKFGKQIFLDVSYYSKDLREDVHSTVHQHSFRTSQKTKTVAVTFPLNRLISISCKQCACCYGRIIYIDRLPLLNFGVILVLR